MLKYAGIIELPAVYDAKLHIKVKLKVMICGLNDGIFVTTIKSPLMQQFKASMSKIVITITLIVHIMVLGTIIPLASNGIALWEVVILPILFLTAFLLRPFRYDVDDRQLIIRKYVLPKRLLITDIASAAPVDYSDLKITLRLWGSGGFWGWYGVFLTAENGSKKILLQCSQKENLVLITMKDGKRIVISPDDRDGLLNSLKL